MPGTVDVGPQTTDHRSFCRFCPNYCGVQVMVRGDEVLRVRGDRAHPRTHGYACPKGRAMASFHHHPARLDRPEMLHRGTLADVGWLECLDHLAAQLSRIREESGPASVGIFMGTAAFRDGIGRPVAERFFAGCDSPSRYSPWTVDNPCDPYVSELMSGHQFLWGVPDDDVSLVILLGTNPMSSHGHIFQIGVPKLTLRKWARQGELWVIDPRRTETAALATRHLAPRPGSDYALLAFLVRELLRDGADRDYIAERTLGVEDLRDAVEGFSLERAARCTGLGADELLALVKAIRRAGRIAVHAGTGVSMSESANVATWLRLALNIVTGSQDRPGGNRFEAASMEGYTGLTVASAGPPSRPDLPLSVLGEYPCAAMADEIEAGNLRALVVVAGNPIVALPNPTRLRAAFGTLDVLAVADVVRTATTEVATHILPCTGQLERMDYKPSGLHDDAWQFTEAAVSAGRERRAMWWIFGQLGRRLGFSCLPEGLDVDSCTEEQVLRGSLHDADIDLHELRSAGYVPGRRSDYGLVDENLPDGRWRLAPPEMVEQLAAQSDPTGDLMLIPRRLRRVQNSVMADGTAGGNPPDRPDLLINPGDARIAGIGPGDTVRVRSAHGQLTVTVRLDARIRRGAVSVPHGWAECNVNELTSETEHVDRLTGMVRMTGVPVTIEPISAV